MEHSFGELLQVYESCPNEALIRLIRLEASSPMVKECATRVLLHRHRRVILAIAKSIFKNQELAEGIVNWVFWNCVLKYKFEAKRRNFRGYVIICTRNYALSERRKYHRMVPHQDMDEYTRNGTSERDVLLRRRIQSLVASFSDDYRRTFTSRHELGMTWSEVEPDPKQHARLRTQDWRNRRRMKEILAAEGAALESRRSLDEHEVSPTRRANATPPRPGDREPQ